MKEKNYFQKLNMDQEELNHYYRMLRKYKYENENIVNGINIRNIYFKFFKNLLKIDRLISKRKLEIINDKRIYTNKSHIYAATHVGRYDIETAFEAIGEHVYFVMGDPSETYKNIEGILLECNGRICLDTGYQIQEYLRHQKEIPDEIKELVEEYKTDRKIAKETCIKYLNNKQNILIFPEAAWNLSSNEIVSKIFKGTSEMAIETGSDIIPVGICNYGKKYIVNIGENINVDGANKCDILKITELLRNSLATLKWEIMESQPKLKREDIPFDAQKRYVESIMCETTSNYTIDVINNSKYIDPIPTSDEVFGPIKQLSRWKF